MTQRPGVDFETKVYRIVIVVLFGITTFYFRSMVAKMDKMYESHIDLQLEFKVFKQNVINYMEFENKKEARREREEDERILKGDGK